MFPKSNRQYKSLALVPNTATIRREDVQEKAPNTTAAANGSCSCVGSFFLNITFPPFSKARVRGATTRPPARTPLARLHCRAVRHHLGIVRNIGWEDSGTEIVRNIGWGMEGILERGS